ncbi:MAG: tRNA lysidine(34) synthetase TilS [Pyrinomonadaceae bacterium]
MTKKDSKKIRAANRKLSTFAARLLDEWQRLKLPVSDATVVVAVSGGADSTALLVGLDELVANGQLDVKFIVAHLDHGLRPKSRKDALWVAQLAEERGHDVVSRRSSLKRVTAKHPQNLEQAARRIRYRFLEQTAARNSSYFVVTGHTLDDQAETILLRLLRGSAAEGLSGTPAVREIRQGSEIKLIRPLLSWARHVDTEAYCRKLNLDFRVDEMNDDESFSRVRVRKQLLPLMKSFNNRIVETLSRTATLLSEDAAALSHEATRLLESAREGPAKNNETGSGKLSVEVLLQAPAAVRRRALREWILRSRGHLRRLEMVHLLAVERLLEPGRGGRIAELPGGMSVLRNRRMLELSAKKRLKKRAPASKIPTR